MLYEIIFANHNNETVPIYDLCFIKVIKEKRQLIFKDNQSLAGSKFCHTVLDRFENAQKIIRDKNNSRNILNGFLFMIKVQT